MLLLQTSFMAQHVTVLVFGTFDLFHPGHEYFLTEAKKHGTRLVVVVARDANVERIKGRRPQQDERARLSRVQQYDAVDEARLGYEAWSQHLTILDEVRPDVICLGYDQQATIPHGPWKVVHIDAFHPEQYKSSLLRTQ